MSQLEHIAHTLAQIAIQQELLLLDLETVRAQARALRALADKLRAQEPAKE